MNATMSRVNGIFNKDLAVRLVLIANNDAIVYLDATDPYSAATTGAAGAWSQEAQTTNNVIGEANMILVIYLVPVEVEMLDASAACVFHLLLIFRWVRKCLHFACRWGSTRRYF
jgi:hypothetical protein